MASASLVRPPGGGACRAGSRADKGDCDSRRGAGSGLASSNKSGSTAEAMGTGGASSSTGGAVSEACDSDRAGCGRRRRDWERFGRLGRFAGDSGCGAAESGAGFDSSGNMSATKCPVQMQKQLENVVNEGSFPE
jgi:hypothetical protein